MARKILLADDSVTAQNMGRKILTDAGYEVVTVNNGSAALKKIVEHKPDLIVLDVYMPGYSGLEVCQRIKENRDTARIPVLLTVGKLEPFKPEEARRARADAFVVKPFEASELLAALTKLEDKVIPQPEPYKPGRFAKAVASFDRDTDASKFTDPDEGWKARLRIPTGPPKSRDTEPDPDYAATQGKGFRDFVEPTAKKNQPKPEAVAAKPEPPLPAGIPHDITPEEIAAITAAAARLSGTAPAPAVLADEGSLNETTTVVEAKPEEVKPEASVAEIEPASAEENAPVTFASSPEISSGDVGSSQVPTEDAFTREIGETVAAPEPVAAVAPEPAEAIPSEIQASAVEPAVPDSESSAAPVMDELAPEPEAAEIAAAPSPEPEIAAESFKPSLPASVEVPSSEIPTTIAPSSKAEAGDDEVMAALHTLMPSAQSSDQVQATNGDTTSEPIIPAAAMADGIVTRAHAAGPRWIAQEIALATDEAAISLEREMEKAYAAVAAEGELRAAKAAPEVMTSPEISSAVSTTSVPAPEPEGAMYAVAYAAAGETMPSQFPQAMPAPAPTESAPAPESSAAENPIAGMATAMPHLPETIATAAAASTTETAIADTSSEYEIVGGTDDMAANWKNIRDSIAGAAAKPAPAKEDFHEPAPATPEPEAAAPEAVSEKSSFAATDPKAIASIVESVLAELRPKIVEEIAKKIADSKKD